MTIQFTPEEIEKGVKVWRLSQKRFTQIKDAITTGDPIRCRGVAVGDKYYWLVIPLSVEPAPEGMSKLTFRPFWNRCYVGCHIRSSDIRIVVLETEKEKVQIESGRWSPCKFTTEGAGVGREAEEDAESLLYTLYGKAEKPSIMQTVNLYLKSTLKAA